MWRLDLSAGTENIDALGYLKIGFGPGKMAQEQW